MRLKSVIIGGTVALALGGGLVTPASAATMAARPTTTATATHKYCATIVSKQLDADGLSHVVGKSCSSNSPVAAFTAAKQLAGQVPNRPEQAAASTLLMNEFYDTNLNGGVIYSFYGSSGTCDSSGYRLRNDGYTRDNTSSIQGNGNCNRVNIQGYNNSAETAFSLPANYLGSYLNDNVALVRVYRG